MSLMDRWWLPPPPPSVLLGHECPGGASFKIAQTWPNGFKAGVVLNGGWRSGLLVMLQWPAAEGLPGWQRPVGATTESTRTL